MTIAKLPHEHHKYKFQFYYTFIVRSMRKTSAKMVRSLSQKVSKKMGERYMIR